MCQLTFQRGEKREVRPLKKKPQSLANVGELLL